MTAALVKQIEASGTPLARYIARFAMLTPGADIMWDELAAAAWIDPTLITKRETRYMGVDLDRGAGYGNTLTWATQRHSRPDAQPVEIQMDLDTEKFYRMFVGLMTVPTPAPTPRSLIAASRWHRSCEQHTIVVTSFPYMSPIPDDLTTVKDDMVAFIEGHGMRRFHGYVDYEEVQCVMWEMGGNPDGWKDFVELAKAAGAPFLTMHSWTLERTELDEMVQRLTNSEFTDGDDVEDARWLRAHVGKVGFLQLGWAYQGSMFLCEVSTEWYERYQHLLEVSDEFGGLTMDEPDQDEEN